MTTSASVDEPKQGGWSLHDCIWYALGVFAIGVPLSVTIAQPFSFVVALIWLVALARGDRSGNPFSVSIAAFVGAVIFASILGVDPAKSFSKLYRFLSLAVVFALPVVLSAGAEDRDRRLRLVVLLFLGGATLKAGYDVVRMTWAMLHLDTFETASEGIETATSPLRVLYAKGNMRDPQMYLTGLCLLLGLMLHRPVGVGRGWIALGLVVQTAALLLHFKRGAWFAAAAAIILVLLLARNRRALVVLTICIVAACFLPQVRGRIMLLKEEFDPEQGGRFPLWTEVAPPLIQDHPMGMGWKAVRHEHFTEVTQNVQPKLNHLHNNVLQMLLELGWLGLAAWLAWFGTVFAVMARSVRAERGAGGLRAAVAVGILGAFAGLFLNGLVEYNFGDSEIFMLMCLLMGLSAHLATSHGAERKGS